VVVVMDLRFTHHRFKSRLVSIALWPWKSYLHMCASVTEQYNLVLAKWGDPFRWKSNCGPSGK